MSNLETWRATNDAYLAEALARLRVSLERLAPRTPSQSLLTDGHDASAPRAERARQRALQPVAAQEVAAAKVAASPKAAATLSVTAVQENDVANGSALTETTDATPPPALLVLAQQLGLSEFERNILLLCCAMELDTRIAALCARAQQDPVRPYPTFALAFSLFEEPEWQALAPDRPLRYWRLIEITQPGAQPLTTSALRADERIVNYVKGLNYLDDRLATWLTPLPPPGQGAEPSRSQQQSVKAIATAIATAGAQRRALPVVQVVGPDLASNRSVAATACARLGLHLYRLPVEILPTQVGEMESLIRLWQRESLLLPIALYIDLHATEKSPTHPSDSTALLRFLARAGGVVLLDSRDGLAQAPEGAITIEVGKPTPVEQNFAWRCGLGEAAGTVPAQLAGQFSLNLADIRDIVTRVRAQENGERSVHERLWEECLARTRPRVEQLAERIAAKATWQDIVLPRAELSLLRQIAAHVRARSQVYDAWGFRARMNRGLGISALFAGESGTGKTMAAEVLANELKLNLYRIDLSAVVSKYIGETEKNLRCVFDAAEDGGALLLFDEADALFGKRSEVKDSHDRYANIEVNYLLQRMEAYRGLAILATNIKSALDPAFMRRLRFIVNFAFPGPGERTQIWKRAFPRNTPAQAIDPARLARLNLTGGNIHSIALNASFLAAAQGTPVTMGLVLEAARTELRKLDRPVNESDLRWIENAGAAA